MARARCMMDERVEDKRCVACPSGTTRDAGDDPDGPETQCMSTTPGGSCGDGVMQPALGEECDETPATQCAYGQQSCMVCNSQCKLVPGQVIGLCGDGIVQSIFNEQCDEPATTQCPYGQQSCMVCDETCQRVPGQIISFCGDGVVQANAGEECAEASAAPQGWRSWLEVEGGSEMKLDDSAR